MAALPSRWAWILQDALGIAFCLYTLKTIRLPTFKVRAPRGGGGALRTRGRGLFVQACPGPSTLSLALCGPCGLGLYVPLATLLGMGLKDQCRVVSRRGGSVCDRWPREHPGGRAEQGRLLAGEVNRGGKTR